MKVQDKKKEQASLREFVNNLFGVEVRSVIRKREYVNARLVYCKILRDRGHTVVEIAKSIHKHHSSIIHYCSYVDTVVVQDETLAEKYLLCKGLFSNDSPIDYTADMMKRIKLLEDENERLLSHKLKSESYSAKYIRLDSIIKLIEERTPVGKEKETLMMLTKFLNGFDFKSIKYHERSKEIG
jgi:hypothetical protein